MQITCLLHINVDVEQFSLVIQQVLVGAVSIQPKVALESVGLQV